MVYKIGIIVVDVVELFKANFFDGLANSGERDKLAESSTGVLVVGILVLILTAPSLCCCGCECNCEGECKCNAGQEVKAPAKPELMEELKELLLPARGDAKQPDDAAKGFTDRPTEEKKTDQEALERVGQPKKPQPELQSVPEQPEQSLEEAAGKLHKPIRDLAPELPAERKVEAPPQPAPVEQKPPLEAAPPPAPEVRGPVQEMHKEAAAVAPAADVKAPVEVKEAPQEQPKEVPKELPRDGIKEAPKEAPKEQPKDEAKGAPLEAPKAPEEVKEQKKVPEEEKLPAPVEPPKANYGEEVKDKKEPEKPITSYGELDVAVAKGEKLAVCEDDVVDVAKYIQTHPEAAKSIGHEIAQLVYQDRLKDLEKEPRRGHILPGPGRFFAELHKGPELSQYEWMIESQDGLTDNYFQITFKTEGVTVMPLHSGVLEFGKHLTLVRKTDNTARSFALVHSIQGDTNTTFASLARAINKGTEFGHPSRDPKLAINDRLCLVSVNNLKFSTWLISDVDNEKEKFSIRGPFVKPVIERSRAQDFVLTQLRQGQ